MTAIADFWKIVDKARKQADGWEDMHEPLVELLAGLEIPKIFLWQQIFDEYQSLSYKNKLWAAAYIINGGCSDDGFDYFRGWLTAQGKKVFMKALADPDSLAKADLCEGEAEFEEILSAAADAYFKKLCQNKPDYERFNAELNKYSLPNEIKAEIAADVRYADDIDAEWKEEDLPKLLPKLSEAFELPEEEDDDSEDGITDEALAEFFTYGPEAQISQLKMWHDAGKHKWITDAIEALPAEKRSYTVLGLYARALNNSGRAAEGYDVLMSIQDEGKNDSAWNYRVGWVHYWYSRYDEALDYLGRALELDENDPNITELIHEVEELSEEKRKRTSARAEQEARRRAAFVPRGPDQEPFEGFDLSDFWYASKESTGADATEEMFSEAEKALGYKLPESYKWLMRKHNGGLPKKDLFVLSGAGTDEQDKISVTCIMGVDPNEENSLCGSLGSKFMIDEWEYPDIGIAVCDCPSAGHEMIFLDYRNCGRDGEPEVVHIDQENDYEITYLAGDFESFIRGLIQEEHGGDGMPELYTEQEIDAIEKHIAAHFGVCRNVFHEIVSPDIHVDIYVIDPTPERNYFTLVTVGMGAHRMDVPEELESMKLDRAELLVTLPPDWKISSNKERWYWPLRWLKILARLPGDEDTWLGYGHTIPNDGPFAKNTKLCCIMLTMPYGFGTEAEVCVLPDGDEINFYQMLPLYENEMNFKLDIDAESLEELFFPEDFDMVVDIARPNFISQHPTLSKVIPRRRGGS